jgi:hypothetical protein
MAFQTILTGDVYDLKSDKLLYKFERLEKKENNKLTIKGVYTDLKGSTLVTEEATFEDGKTTSLKVSQLQTKETSSIIVTEKKIVFTKGEDVEKEDIQKNFIVGMSTISFLEMHWNSILEGKTVSTRFGVWYRQDTVGFDFYKTSDKDGILEITMNPSSFFIKQLVDPLVFKFDKKTKRIKEVIGRTSPKIEIDGKLKDLDARVVYKYK